MALWSIPFALGILLLKGAAWRLTGSIALLSDALESIVNVIAALLAFYAVRLSDKPADARHPFGHSKAEYLSAVAEGVMIVLAALLIFREAGIALLGNPTLEDASFAGIAVNLSATLLNGTWAFLLLKAGRKHRSPTLQANARHIFTDVFTSGGVLLGLVLALATGLHVLDPILAILVGLNILREGAKVIQNSLNGLMDASADASDLENISTIIADTMGDALRFHDLRTRWSGPTLFVEFHLVVHRGVSVGDAHHICDRMEAALKAAYPNSAMSIHVEPDSELR